MKKYLKIVSACGCLVAGVFVRAGTAPSVPSNDEPVARVLAKPKILHGSAFDEISFESAMGIIEDYVENGSFDAIVRALKGASFERVQEIATAVISGQDSELTREDKLQLLYGLSLNFEDKNLFPLILKYDFMQEGAPLLYVAADGVYSGIVSRLEEWALLFGEKGATRPTILEHKLDKAIRHAVEQDNANVLQVLKSYNLTPSTSYATEMLIHAAQHDAGQDVARALIRNEADVNFSQAGMTPLMIAVRRSNLPMVKVLVKHPGIEINKVVDVAVGSALQQLLEKDVLTDDDQRIEVLLRENGAVE